jgi:hypothetical protein
MQEATMAGGYGRGDQGRLVDRIDAALAEPPTIPRSPARHCRIDGEPALLVEWRRGSAGWEGRVISMVWLDEVGWATLERWLPAEAMAAH